MPVRERKKIEQKILVAVDFGTTFSSIAWGTTGEDSAQNIIQNWPDKHSKGPEAKSHDKVPTTLKYDRNGGYRWGYQIGRKEKRHEWFKLGLDKSMQHDVSSLASRFPTSTQLPSSRDETSPSKLTTDYLAKLHQHTTYMLSQTVTEADLKRIPREYVITVPAIWSYPARDLTSSCAVDAGMGPRDKLHIITEPEAAAMYAFKEMSSCGLKKGDTFVLCDAGGGTVDLISYTVQSLDPILQLEEAAPGSGGACGSTFLDRIFAKMLNDKFKGDLDWESDDGIFENAMDVFENHIKSAFDGSKGDEIPVRGLAPRPGIKKGCLELSRNQLRDVFEPVISEIITLIRDQKEQTAKPVKLILLVGGFGESYYLRERIRKTFDGIEVLKSPNPQSAVVRGALMKGLAEAKGVTTELPRISVASRIARKHYGTKCFIACEESDRRAQPNPFTGGFMVESMRWFLKKGEKVKESIPIPFTFGLDHPVSKGKPREISIDIYSYADPMNTGAPKFKNPDVLELGKVTADIGDIKIPKERGNDGREYYVADFEIEMRCYAAEIEFTPVYDGVAYKTAKIEYA